MGYNKADFLAGVAAGRNMRSWPVIDQSGEPDVIALVIVVGDTIHSSLTYSIGCQPYGTQPYDEGMIYWGDGQSTVIHHGAGLYGYEHTYDTAGTYIIHVTNLMAFQAGYGYWDPPAVRAVYGNFPETMGEYGIDHAFRSCRNITAIPQGIFKKCKNVVSAYDAFDGCEKLGAIPEGLFDGCPNIRSFDNTFIGCRSLKEIPSELFYKQSDVTDFANCFGGCSGLLAIPHGLFDHCKNVEYFNGCFSGCLSITAIPSGLFDDHSVIKNMNGCFSGTSITSIPARLFDACGQVTNFLNCFGNCMMLTSIPEHLFDHCVSAAYFDRCFQNCPQLASVPLALFDYVDASNGSFIQCFYYDSSITSAVPELWNLFPSAMGSECYEGCTNAANYADIPSAWR